MIDPLLVYAAAATLAGILLAGSLGKLTGFTDFENAVAGYALLPGMLVRPFALLFAAAEVLAAVLLLTPAARESGAALAMLLLLAATVGIIANLLRGRRDIDCGCGGFSQRSSGLSWWLVLRNSLLLALAVPALLAGHAGTRSLGWIDGISFFGATLAALGLYFCLNQLIAAHERFQKN